MKKEMKNIKKSNYKLSLIVLGTTILSISAIGYSIHTIVDSSHNELSKLNTLLDEYGYTNEEFSLYQSGYVLGEKTSYYSKTYELNTNDNIINEEKLYKDLKTIYTGKNKEEYIKGLEKGIEDGENKAIENQKVKVRVFTKNS